MKKFYDKVLVLGQTNEHKGDKYLKMYPVKKSFKLYFAIALLLFNFKYVQAQEKVNGVFAGGAVHDPSQPISNIDELRKSGFNTVIVWTIHILEDGSLNLNYVNDLISEGKYVGGQELVERIARLKQQPTGITRLEFGLGSWEGQQFEVIKKFYEQDGGFPPSSPIYKNFKLLKETFPFVDAINNDDEVTYDLPSAVAFTKMLASFGFKNAIAPYKNNQSFWKPLVEQVNRAYHGNMDRNYLQCYAGGASNSVCDSNWDFGIPIIGGLWGSTNKNNPEALSREDILRQMKSWKQGCGVDSGFLWLYDDFVGKAKKYARVVKKACK